MKIIVSALFFLLLLVSCTSEPKDQIADVEVENEKGDVPDEKVVYRDTTHSFSGIGEYYSFKREMYDTLITINNKNYRLHLESKLDPDMRVLHNQCYPDKDVLHCYSNVGYQGYYTISLFEGGKKAFTRKLTKEDFKEAEYNLVITSGAFLPDLVEYNSRFEAFILQVPFYAEGTCWASQALLVVGLDGKVKIVDRLSGTSENSANHYVQISPDHASLISATAIHYANGKSLSFIKDDADYMGADIFDDCLLVVYDYDSRKQAKNAYLKDYQGKTLLNFRYEGWTGGLGYSFLRKKVKNAYYFIDEPNKRLIRVKKVKNKWTYKNLPFSGMDEFNGEEYLADQMVDLSTEMNEFIFYINTSSGEIRKITSNR